MGELSKIQKTELGRIYYVVNGLNAKETAEKIGISENTFSKWVEKYGWKFLKAAEIGRADNLIAALEDDIIAIHRKAKDEQRPINAQEADAIYKTTLSIRNIGKDFGIDVYNAVLQEFFNYSRDIDAAFQQRGVDLCDGFLVIKLRQRGN